jgi:hypothetical protein
LTETISTLAIYTAVLAGISLIFAQQITDAINIILSVLLNHQKVRLVVEREYVDGDGRKFRASKGVKGLRLTIAEILVRF